MSIHFENSVVVDRPIGEIWPVVMDFFNAPRLSRRQGLLSMRQTSPGPMGVGSTYSERRVILGFETRLMARVTEWDPPNAVAVTMEGGPFRSLVDRFTVEAAADGATVAESGEFELRPILKPLWLVIGPFILRRRRVAFRDLKSTLETWIPS
jgi:hypothetical protein